MVYVKKDTAIKSGKSVRKNKVSSKGEGSAKRLVLNAGDRLCCYNNHGELKIYWFVLLCNTFAWGLLPWDKKIMPPLNVSPDVFIKLLFLSCTAGLVSFSRLPSDAYSSFFCAIVPICK